jgi:hypothetical protein
VARETWTVKFDAKVVASFTDAHLAHAVKIVGISDDLDPVAACEKVAQNILGEKASAARSQPYSLDVTHPEANKGSRPFAQDIVLDCRVPQRRAPAVRTLKRIIPQLCWAIRLIRLAALSSAVASCSN